MMMMITIVIGWLAPIPAHIYILKPSQGLARLILQPAYASRGIYCTPAAYAYIAVPAYIPFRGAYTAVFIATLGSMAHTDIKFHGSYHQPTLSSSFDNNLLILTQGSNRVTREHSSVTLWLPGFSQKTSNSLMFLGPVDSSSSSSSSSRVATEGRKGLRGHSSGITVHTV